MLKKCYTILAIQFLSFAAISQQTFIDSTSKNTLDTIPNGDDLNYDDLFKDLASFLDSISQPRSYFLASLSIGKGYLNFKSKSSVLLEAAQKLTYLPTLGYYHKDGFGFTATGSLVNDENTMNLYQFSLSPSFDYLKNLDWGTGVAYSRFFTKDSLTFYTSPLKNELYGYFTYRKWWIRPMVAISYGWGSRSDYAQRQELINSLRLRRRGYTRVNTTESIADLSLVTSVRHDFYWLNVLVSQDHIRLTPQVSFTNGTQKFGFNQSSSTYATNRRNRSNVLYNSENIDLNDKVNFQPLSLALYLRSEYSFKKFFIQPQLVFDYYFPATEKKFNTLISLDAGFMF